MVEATAPPSLRRRLLVSAVLVALAVAGGGGAFRVLAGLRRPPARAATGAPLPVVRTARLAVEDVVEDIRGYGIARALRVATVNAEVGGIVIEVSDGLRVGAEVTGPPPGGGEGSVAAATPPLVRLDRRDLEDALARWQAERDQAQADLTRQGVQIRTLSDQIEVSQERLRTASAELERIRGLVPDRVPESDLDQQRLQVLAIRQVQSELESRRSQAESEIDAIEARLRALDATGRQLERDLGRATVYAPFEGRVTARHVEPGQQVQPGTPLFDLLDPGRVEVAISLPAARWTEVLQGAPVTLRAAVGGAVLWEGLVARVAPTVDPAERTFQVFVEVEQDPDAPRVAPGAQVVAEVDGRAWPDVVPVPRIAFVGDVVYLVEASGEPGVGVARARRPTVLRRLPAVALVAAGDGVLGDGDEVVVTNLEDVSEGTRLRVAPPLDAGGSTDDRAGAAPEADDRAPAAPTPPAPSR